MEFENKAIVVTGGATGIGYAAAMAFAQHGAAVTIADVNAPKGSEAAEEIQSRGGRAHYVEADVSQARDAERIARETVRAFGRLDVLHNNAAIQTFGTVMTTSEDLWDRTLAVNLKSVYLCAKYCIPEMIKAGGGSHRKHLFGTRPGYPERDGCLRSC